MSYKDEDLEKINVPDYTLRHNELPEDLLHKVIIAAKEAIKQTTLDKDAAIIVCEVLRKDPQFDIGQGEWQCIIGKRFSASLTYDTGVLLFFDLKHVWKSVLVFCSG